MSTGESFTNKKLQIDFDLTPDSPSSKTALPAETVVTIQNVVRKKDEFPLEETQTRNLLIVGRTRSGKSTAVGVMKDPAFEPKDMSLFSDTVEPKFQSFALDDRSSGTKYTLNIVDTPGLKEVWEEEKGVSRSDEAIVQTITYCLRNEITKINALLIFVAFELGITNDDLESFKIFVDSFYHSSISIVICVTHAENKDDHWKGKIVSQLKQHAYFKKLIEENKNVTVQFMGAVDKDTIRTTYDQKELIDRYKTVYNLRKRLLQTIFDADSNAKLIDLPIASSSKKNLNEIFQNQLRILSNLEKCVDFEVGRVHLEVEEFANNIEILSSKQGFLTDPELLSQFNEMKRRMKKVASSMPEKLRTKFVNSVII